MIHHVGNVLIPLVHTTVAANRDIEKLDLYVKVFKNNGSHFQYLTN